VKGPETQIHIRPPWNQPGRLAEENSHAE